MRESMEIYPRTAAERAMKLHEVNGTFLINPLIWGRYAGATCSTPRLYLGNFKSL